MKSLCSVTLQAQAHSTPIFSPNILISELKVATSTRFGLQLKLPRDLWPITVLQRDRVNLVACQHQQNNLLIPKNTCMRHLLMQLQNLSLWMIKYTFAIFSDYIVDVFSLVTKYDQEPSSTEYLHDAL